MNAARATENASVEEDPTPLTDGLAPVTDEDVDAEHIRAVWEMAALTALDGIRGTPGTGTAGALGPGPAGGGTAGGTADAPGSGGPVGDDAAGVPLPAGPAGELPGGSRAAWGAGANGGGAGEAPAACGPVGGATGGAPRPGGGAGDAQEPAGTAAGGPGAARGADGGADGGAAARARGPEDAVAGGVGDALRAGDAGGTVWGAASGAAAVRNAAAGPRPENRSTVSGAADSRDTPGRRSEEYAAGGVRREPAADAAVWAEPDTEIARDGGAGNRTDQQERAADGGPAAAGRSAFGERRGAGMSGRSAPGERRGAGAAVRAGDERLTDRFRTGDGAADAAPPRRAARRGGGDPVKGLLHQHRDLCEQAVDPFEIAAALEAHGLTDRTAARFRHRDVFALAEEMFARAERSTAAVRPARAAEPRTGRAGVPLRAAAPGIVCALALAAAAVTDGGQRIAAGAAGALATGLALLYALRSGPLRARGRRTPGAARLWTLWLLGYAVCGQGLIGEIAGGGPEGRVPLSAVPLLSLAVAVVPAAWCARLFAVRAGRRIRSSRGLDEFAAGTRPLLLAVVALYTAVLAVLAVLTVLVLPEAPGAAGGAGAAGPVVALGTLFFLARLLIVHGCPGPASAALATACAVEAAVPALLLSGRLPGLGPLARPAELLVAEWGAAAVPVLACTGAALALLVHAFTVLVRASAHTP
ncbi:hypothetical protein [Streptomyces sp. t39]|uniref:hypothetical protein n=1 Tax=Streptomyces sp. t39 TaxID=1828156 RepID=UPI0011CD4E03|nr:hypothetical protein [Streptomyces sp. t39]TXS56792.1 hypothetical protein EAO77_12295 [Streptomyces sp. t39]